MSDLERLKTLREAADRADKEFDDQCQFVYVDGRWGAYRAIECGQKVPKDILTALDKAHAARHAYYQARDGEKGFLGSRGL